jgi:uncharacterized protein YdeI (YjbR/CyaY-like superfamily)
MAVYKWTTPKGAAIELDYSVSTEHYTEIIDADGPKVEVAKTRRVCTINATVNGTTYPAKLGTTKQDGKWVDAVKFALNDRQAAIVIPDHIRQAMATPNPAEAALDKFEAEQEAFTRRWESGYGDAEINTRR